MRRVVGLLLLLGLLAGCGGSGGGGAIIATDEAAIRQAYRDIANAFTYESTAAFHVHLSPDYLHNGYTKSKFIALVEDVFDPYDALVFNFAYSIDHIVIGGEWAWGYGKATLTVRNKQTGEVVTIPSLGTSDETPNWHKENGVWQLYGNQKAAPE